MSTHDDDVFTMCTKGGEDGPDGSGDNSSTSYSYYAILHKIVGDLLIKGYFQYNYIFEQGQRKRIQYNSPEKPKKNASECVHSRQATVMK